MRTIINPRGAPARWAPFVLWVLSVLFLSPAHAQPITFRAKLQQGDVLRYDLAAQIEVGPAKGPADRLEQHARLRLIVAEIDEEGVATIRGGLESLSAKWSPTDAEPATFDWKEGQQLTDDAPPFAKACGTLATTPLELTVAPDGTVRSASGPEKAVAAAEAAGLERGDRILGALGPAAILRTLAPVFALDREGAGRKVGDRWTDESKLPGIGGAAVKVATERTLKKVEDGVAQIDATLTQAWLHPSGQPDPTEPTATASDQSGTADERWDTKAGRLTSRTQDTRITWTFQIQAVKPIEAMRKVHARVELKMLAQSPSKP